MTAAPNPMGAQVSDPLRAPVLDGHRRIDALWFPAGWFDEARRRDEMLAVWRRGCTAHRFADGDLLRWPDGVPQDCAALGGWPLQRIGATLCSAAIEPARAAEHAADVLLVVGARLRALQWSQAQPLDPSQWISIDGFALLDAYDFRLPPPARIVVAPSAKDLRAVLGAAIPDPDAKAQALLQALRQRAASPGAGAKADGKPATAQANATPRRNVLPWLIGIGLLGTLAHLLDAPQPAESPQVTVPPRAAPDAPPQMAAPPTSGPQALVLPSESSQDVAGSVLPASPLTTGPARGQRFDDVAPFGTFEPRVQVPRRASSPAGALAGQHSAAPVPAPAASRPPHVPGAAVAGEAAGASFGFWNSAGATLMLVFAVVIALLLRAARTRLLKGDRAPAGGGFAPIVMGRDGPTSARPAAPEPGGVARTAKAHSSSVAAGAQPAGPGPVNGGAGGRGKLAAALRARAQRVMPQRWRAWLARLAMTSGVADLLGRQHATYMRRMLALFEQGDLDAALRHALPLGSGQNSLGQALGRLAPRRDLALGQPQRAGTRVGVGDDLERHLRALYRRTFEQLDRAGRIDEATYVLAELLAQRGEALDYLEKHARHAQAAELALAWDMPAARIVRLLVQAGDWRRAVLVAQRDDAFAAAVAQLEPRWRDAAARLRREWAHRLATRGRPLEAVHAIWPVEAERASALEWLGQIEAAGACARCATTPRGLQTAWRWRASCSRRRRS